MTMKCLKQGDSGADVTTLQGDLASRGYGPCQSLYDGSIDCDWTPGTFGSAVYSAVREFQLSQGWTTRAEGLDGIAGPDTWRALGRTGASCGSGRAATGTTDTGIIPAAPTGNGNGDGLALYQRPWFWPTVGTAVVVLILGGLWRSTRETG